MTDPAQKAKTWLQFAKSDLDMAQVLGNNPRFWGGAVFHCQQCAEKSLKALLLLDNRPEDKDFRTHNLRLLQQKATLFYPEIQQLGKTVVSLFELDTAYRYPNDEYDALPTQTEFQNAFNSAKKIYQISAEIFESKLKTQRSKQQTPEQIWESLSKSFSSTGVKLSQQVALKAFQNKHSEETVAQILANDPKAIDLMQREGSDRANQYIKTIINGAKFTLRQSPRPQQDIDLEP